MNKPIVAIFALLLSLNVSTAMYADTRLSTPSQYLGVAEYGKPSHFVGDPFARTELYFGTARSDNQPPVSDTEFQGFLDNVITPAFPDGLTLLKGLGQFRGANGITVKEDSFLVILLYPAEARRESSKKIEHIREEYKKQFSQESVLRSDACCERVGF